MPCRIIEIDMNVFGYLEKFGKVSFKKSKFKETDSLIFSQLSYLKFERVFSAVAKGRKFVPLTDFLKLDNKQVLVEGTNKPAEYEALWNAVMASKRFSTLQIGFVKEVFDTEKDIQFMAMTFKSEDWTRYIVFRGTDGTLCGWKEDCNLCILNEIPAQVEAAKYVDEVVSWSLFPFNIIGHSKGGNLAEYAALKMKKRYGKRLKGVYNHDGPGFDKPMIFDQSILKDLTPKFHKVVPGESVIGMLLTQLHDYKVVLAETSEFFQHSIFYWEIDDSTGDMVELEDRSSTSKSTEKYIKNLLDPLPLADRMIIVSAIFEALGYGGRTTIYEVFNLSKIELLKIFAITFAKYDNSTKMLLLKYGFEFVKFRLAAKEKTKTDLVRKNAAE